MGLSIPVGAEAAYATNGNVAFPGTSAAKTAAETFAVSDLDAHIDDISGSGITISSVTIVAAR